MNALRRFLRRLLPTRINTRYRGWHLAITSLGVIGHHKASGEYFIIGRVGGIEEAMRLAKNKVDRLKGDEVWNEEYQQEALR